MIRTGMISGEVCWRLKEEGHKRGTEEVMTEESNWLLSSIWDKGCRDVREETEK